MWFHWCPSSFPGDHDFTGTLTPNHTKAMSDHCKDQSTEDPKLSVVWSPELGPGCGLDLNLFLWPKLEPADQDGQWEEPNSIPVKRLLCEAQGRVVQQEPHTGRCGGNPIVRRNNHAETNQ